MPLVRVNAPYLAKFVWNPFTWNLTELFVDYLGVPKLSFALVYSRTPQYRQ